MIGDLPKNDFNGDGRSDIHWVTQGYTNIWASNGSGGFDANWWVLPSTNYIFAVSDFTNKGREQVLIYQIDTGKQMLVELSADASMTIDENWLMTTGWPDGIYGYINSADVNGDHYSDFILTDHYGAYTAWLGRTNGSGVDFQPASISFTPEWFVLATGDFDGDGKADILLQRNDGWLTNWLGTASGTFTNNGANTALYFQSNWHVVGTGDFNGDGRDDMLLRSDEGWVTNWLATANGGFTNNGAAAATFLTTDWRIETIGDFNGDGKDDLVVRRNDGWMTEWLGTEDGSFDTSGNFTTFVAPAWEIVDVLVRDPWPGFGNWIY